MLIGENLFELEKERRNVDSEKFMTFVRSKLVDDWMYYLLLDEVQRVGQFETVLRSCAQITDTFIL